MASRKRTGEKILVAEDEKDFRLYLYDVLSDVFDVSCVGSGIELYALLSTCHNMYDCVLTDLVMPNWSGEEGIEMAQLFGHKVPVVFMSGLVDGKPESIECDFIAKPFNRDELYKVIRKALAKRKR